MFLSPVNGEGATVEENDDEGFAGGGDSFEKLLLSGRELDVGAVSAGEACDVEGHLFAFELPGEADKGEDDVGLTSRGDGVGEQGSGGRYPLKGYAGSRRGGALWVYSRRRAWPRVIGEVQG